MGSRNIAPTVRIKKDQSKKLKFRVYYRESGRNVYVSSHATRTGKDGAEAAKKKAQDDLDARYGTAEEETSAPGVGGFSDHIDEFIKYCKGKKLAPATIGFYEEKLGFLVNKLGRASLRNLDRNRVKLAIKSANNGPTWGKGILGALSAYMNWGYSRAVPLCPPSFTKFIDLEHPRPTRHKNYYTVEEVRALMNHCKDDARRYPMALKFFAGIRTEELNRLTWDYIDFRSQTIYIPETIGKTAGNMEALPDILWHWLDGAPQTGRVYDGVARYVLRNVRRNIEEITEYHGATSRRTFATYASNHFGVERTRKWMRQSDKLTTLEQKYIGCVTHRKNKPYIATNEVSKCYFEI
ncbi:site-specific integrase [Pelagicoccus mobilis]|uniref:Site-specific integrase n=1 Tax=Pelagicoccus mobilis TaxID=415221 RepID=A0A934VJX6_9BACT|nr:site-specific integrase [Pelagicoccus mobilis]MBK1876081.1 site-specific integrase [Pelagicoccus mobilis]